MYHSLLYLNNEQGYNKIELKTFANTTFSGHSFSALVHWQWVVCTTGSVLGFVCLLLCWKVRRQGRVDSGWVLLRRNTLTWHSTKARSLSLCIHTQQVLTSHTHCLSCGLFHDSCHVSPSAEQSWSQEGNQGGSELDPRLPLCPALKSNPVFYHLHYMLLGNLHWPEFFNFMLFPVWSF